MTPPVALADIGVNLADHRFERDRADVVTRARNAGVRLQIVTGTSAEGSLAARDLSSRFADLFFTVGVHPHDANEFDASTPALLRELAGEPKACALGETGLDFNRDFSARPAQERAFEEQLALAAALGMPVFLHQRDAHERFLPLLKAWRDQLPGAVVHCFTGSRAELFDYLDLDCHIGITGWVCDERRGRPLQELMPSIPARRLLVETDSPYLLPRDLPRKPPVAGRNEPGLLPWIVETVARCRGTAFQAVAAQTWENTLALFRINPPGTAPDPESAGHPAG